MKLRLLLPLFTASGLDNILYLVSIYKTIGKEILLVPLHHKILIAFRGCRFLNNDFQSHHTILNQENKNGQEWNYERGLIYIALYKSHKRFTSV